MKNGARILRTAILCLSAAGLVWFCIPVFWGVANIGNIAGFCACAVVLFACLFRNGIKSACRHSKVLRKFALAFTVLFFLGIAWTAAMTACMISVPLAVPPDGATVVVLGSLVSGSSPSADLWARINAAAGYLKEHPQSKCVASGSRGPRENRTEAAVIKDCLIQQGIDSSRILTEEKSANTKENFAQSLKIIDQNSLSRNLAVVTDEYHEFRACSIARSMGAQPYAVPAATPWYIFSACWAREVLALTKYLLIPG